MGKIGDLWVKLGLKKEEFDKGMEDVNKKSEGMGGTFGKIKAAGLAAWAAIGAGVLKLGSDLVKATNQAEDAWAMFTTKAKAGWNAFVKTLLNGEWDKFMQRFKEDIAAAEILQEALDADTEIANSIALKKAMYADELAKLQVIARDTTKTDKERLAAAERYKAIIKEIYDQELERAQQLRKATYRSFLPGRNEEYFSDDVLAMLDQALVMYGQLDKIASLGNRTFSEAVAEAFVADDIDVAGDAVKKVNWGLDGKISESDMRAGHTQSYLRGQIAKYFKEQMKAANISTEGVLVEALLSDFFKNYETSKNGDEVQALIASIIDTEKAKSAFNELTSRMQVLTAKLSEDIGEMQEEVGDEIEDNEIEIPDIDVTPIEEAEKAIDSFLEKWREDQAAIAELNKMIEDSIVSSMRNGLQAITDMIMGLEGASPVQALGALLEPFAQTAITLGEMLVAQGLGIEAFKKSLQSLDGGAAIAAGVGLIALGSAMRSGIQALANKGAGSASTSYSGEGASAANTETYKTELTVYVEGRISGKDIVLSGNNTLSSWRR
jgi:hypothetical protein